MAIVLVDYRTQQSHGHSLLLKINIKLLVAGTTIRHDELSVDTPRKMSYRNNEEDRLSAK